MALFNYECDEVKKKIDEVSPNYPQLTTYEKEWLFFHRYHYIPGIPVELEYKIVSVNPTGSVSNAIPFQYKSAILKGNTKYRDIVTGDILDTFDETKKLELVSVKMPVLTTTGKNIFNEKNIIPNKYQNSNIPSSSFSIAPNEDNGITGFVEVKGNTTYTLSNTINYSGAFYDKDKQPIRNTRIGTSTFTTPINCAFVVLNISMDRINNGEKFQIEEGTTSTPYEPFKSNILTVYEEVELRGVEDGQDELNLNTGEYVQRIGEVVLNGNENWVQRGSILTNTIPFAISFKEASSKSTIICDKFKNIGSWTLDEEHIWLDNTTLQIHISKTKASSVSEFKTWLANNNVRLNFKVSQESVKTVDLTPLTRPYEGVNNYHLTSNIPCEAILEVPIVSTGEQTLEEINN